MTGLKHKHPVLGLWTRLLLLLGGCAAGFAIASYPEETLQAGVSRSAAGVVQRPPGTVTGTATAAAIGTRSAENCEPDTSPAVQQHTDAIAADKPRTIDGWYRAFIEQARDDAWALQIEADIGDAVAASRVASMQVDYVACGSSRCAVAGSVDVLAGVDSCEIGQWLGKAHVFRYSFDYTCVDQHDAGIQRFVVFIDAERPL